MVPLLRGRLVCFYCGCRSTHPRKSDIREWLCERCEAVNHLDENGEITDPPPIDTFSTARYARSLEKQFPQASHIPDDSLFCPQCMKNQHIQSQALASYYPSPDSPDYEEYERRLPDFRKGLNTRYPTVCEECEPRVGERLRATDYVAKTDHLRRMIEKSRGVGSEVREWNEKKFVVFLGGIGWSASWMGQLLWDVISLLALEKEHQGLLDEDASSLDSTYLCRVMRGSKITLDCIEHVNPSLRLVLALGLFSVWWNPRLQEKLKKKGGRIVGMREYYKLQGISLALRFATWALTVRSGLDQQTFQAVHSFMLVFSVLSILMSFRSVQLDFTSRVLFQDSPQPQETRNPSKSTTSIGFGDKEIATRRLTSKVSRHDANRQSFSIHDLAPLTQQAHLFPYQSSTPPLDYDPEENMDWAPSQQSPHPTLSCLRPHTTPQQYQQAPSHGHQTLDITSSASKRQPSNNPLAVLQSSGAKSRQAFGSPSKSALRSSDSVSDIGTDYEPSIADTTSSAFSPHKFANPKFFPISDYCADTGLEALFTSTFSLAEEPSEVRAALPKHRQTMNQTINSFSKLVSAKWLQMLGFFMGFIMLVVSNYCWTRSFKSHLDTHQLRFRFAALGMTSLVLIKSFVVSIRKDMTYWSISDMMLVGFELCGLVNLGVILHKPCTDPLSTFTQWAVDTAGSILITVTTLHEIWTFAVAIWNAEVGSLPPTPPRSKPLADVPFLCNPDKQPVLAPLRQSQDMVLSRNPESEDIIQHVPSASIQRSTRSETRNRNEVETEDRIGRLSLRENETSQQARGTYVKNPAWSGRTQNGRW